jgi:hypothetical protein
MSSVVISGNTSGTITLDAPAVAGTTVLTLPATTGTVITTGNIPTGSVLQVVSTTKTDTFTTSSTTDVEITGLSATITPTSATSKILVLVNIGASGTTTSDYGLYFSLYRSASLITGSVGSSPGSRKACTSASRSSSDSRFQSTSIIYYDAPASTSSLTYACYMSIESGGGTAAINRSGADTNIAAFPRTISTITVMEIAA